MFDAIIRFSLRHRSLVLAITAFILVYGWLALRSLPIDVLPDLNRPTVNIITESPGMAPEEVELLVSRPIEIALNGTAGVTRIFSTSATGLSVVRVEFEWDSSLQEARRIVSERLQFAERGLPEGARPFLSPTSSIMGEILMIGLARMGQEPTMTELRSAADWVVRPRLLSIPGVSQVIVIGGEELQAQVLVNAEKLRKRQVSILELRERLSKLSEASGGGYLTAGDKEWLIRNFGRILSHQEIAETAIGLHLGEPIILKEVAEVVFAAAPKRGEAAVSGAPGVILMVQKQPSADTLKVTAAVDEALRSLETSLPKGSAIQAGLFRQADFIERAIGNVFEALRDGSLMVSLVLILFLLNLRTTVITLTAIPLSLLITAIVFKIFGIGVNTMTLGGLAIAIGELVDDAVVDVENVFRRLRENRLAAQPRNPLVVVYEASREIRNSIVFATIIVVLVFVPLFALPGVEGRIFTPIGLGYVVSLLASLLVSLTVTPVLCSLLLGKQAHESSEAIVVRVLKSIDRAVLTRTLDRPWILIGTCVVLFAVALTRISHMGRDFLPPFNEGSAMLEVEARPGISLEASNALAHKVEEGLLTIPEVVSIGRRTGRADEDDHAAGVHSSEFEIKLMDHGRSREEVFAEIRSKAKELLPAEVFTSLSQPISHRVDHILSGVKSEVALKVFGGDLRVLRQEAAKVRNALRAVPGIVDLRMEGQVLFPQYKIYALRPELQQFGIVPGDLMRSLETMLQGSAVTRLIERERSLEVFLRLDQESRKSIDTIRSIPVHVTPTGRVITLNDVADIFETSGPSTLERENLERRMVVSFNTSGRDLDSVVSDVQEVLRGIPPPPVGYRIEIDGQYRNQQQAMRWVLILGAISLGCIFIVLFSHFGSAAVALQIMVNIPLALIGAVMAIALTDNTLSVASLIGFVTLCGIASRNGIMMISHYIHLMREEGVPFSKEMIVRGSLERLVPVLMTAFSAILALSPLLLAADQPGKELLHPVAVVIVGGLLSSTLLDIIVTPVVFYRFGRKYAQIMVGHSDSDPFR